MDIFRQLVRFIRAQVRRIRPGDVPGDGGLMVDPGGGIDDGVNYALPYLLPGFVQRAAERSAPVQEALKESMERYRSQFGDPYTKTDAPFSPPTEDPLREWDWSTREHVLTACHAAYTRNPLANSIIEFTTDFVVGDGFNLVCRNKAVEKVLQEFMQNPDNAVREYERQAVTDLQVDGELFVRFFGEKGDVVMVPQRPWEVQWIETESGFFRRPVIYHMQRYITKGDAPEGQQSEQDDVDAAKMLHVAINRHSYELRGRPELYRLLPWLGADKEWLEDRSRQNKWRGALLFHVKVGRAAGNILAAVKAQWRRPPPPGSAYVNSDAVEVNAVTNSVGGSDAGHDGRAIRLMNILGARMPEYFFGDGHNANLATAKKQELPALTKFETFQLIMINRLWTPVFQRVIEAAIEANALPEMVPVEDADGDPVEGEERIKAVESFTVTYEPVTGDDLKTITEAYTLMKREDWIDDQTAQEKLGLDVQLIRKRIKAQGERDQDDRAAGRKPFPPGMMPPGMGGDPDELPDDDAPEDSNVNRQDAEMEREPA